MNEKINIKFRGSPIISLELQTVSLSYLLKGHQNQGFTKQKSCNILTTFILEKFLT